MSVEARRQQLLELGRDHFGNRVIDAQIPDDGVRPRGKAPQRVLALHRLDELDSVVRARVVPEVARDLLLFDDRWFLLNLDGRGGKLKGTDTLCATAVLGFTQVRGVRPRLPGSPKYGHPSFQVTGDSAVSRPTEL